MATAGNLTITLAVQVNNQEIDMTAATPALFVSRHGRNITIANFAPATDIIQFSKAVFANVNAILAATHDDALGNAVITDSAHDIITLQHVTTAQLLVHQSDFHVV